MEVKQAYDIWADQYDLNINKTRDLEATSLRDALKNIQIRNCLELGCGTGKNTQWLKSKADKVTAVDFSEEMLAKARNKLMGDNVEFVQADITKTWAFVNELYDLVTFSLVLEHIENLNDIFEKVSNATKSKAIVYLGELHPFKQYAGTKARFDLGEGQQIIPCFNHHISDFILSAKNYNLEIIDMKEYFDEDDRKTIPRILTLIFIKK
jgi:ubiquinone/menaquinone biosynthesis C-methylase UbiE